MTLSFNITLWLHVYISFTVWTVCLSRQYIRMHNQLTHNHRIITLLKHYKQIYIAIGLSVVRLSFESRQYRDRISNERRLKLWILISTNVAWYLQHKKNPSRDLSMSVEAL